MARSTKRARESVSDASEPEDWSASDSEDARSSNEESDSDEYVPQGAKSAKKNKKKAKKKELPSRASILILAENPEESLAHVDKSVITRIVKALNLANHPGTSEQEAKAALRMANKLMSQHSVTQAAVLETVKDDGERLKKGGMSTVSVRCGEGKKMNVSTWSAIVASAMEEFFTCKYYTEGFHGDNFNRVDYVFYGLIEQSIAASYAFEMAYNLIMTWRVQNKNAKGIHEKNLYCTGVADGLLRLALDEKKKEEQKVAKKERLRLEAAQRVEAEERKKQIARLRLPEIEHPADTKPRHKVKIEGVEKDVVVKIENELDVVVKKEEELKKEEEVDIKLEDVEVTFELDGLNERTEWEEGASAKDGFDRRARVEDAEEDNINAPQAVPSADQAGINRGSLTPSNSDGLAAYGSHDSDFASDNDDDGDNNDDDDYNDDDDEYDNSGNEADTRADMDLDTADVVNADFTCADDASALDIDALSERVNGQAAASPWGSKPLEIASNALPVQRPAVKTPSSHVRTSVAADKSSHDEQYGEHKPKQFESALQLMTLRENAAKVADVVYENAFPGQKLRKGRRLPEVQLNSRRERKCYRKGLEDARKIDVKRRRIKDVEEDLVY